VMEGMGAEAYLRLVLDGPGHVGHPHILFMKLR